MKGTERAPQPDPLAATRAVLAWIVRSWWRPAGSEAGWEQRGRRVPH
jgi:hypothetical protein